MLANSVFPSARLIFASILAASFGTLPVGAQDPELSVENLVIIKTEGEVEIVAKDGTRRFAAALSSDSELKGEGNLLRAGERIVTGEGACAHAVMTGGSTFRLEEDAEMEVPAAEPDKEAGTLNLLKGKLFLDVKPATTPENEKAEFRLKTPALILAVKGTHFFAEVQEDKSELVGVNEGEISVSTERNGQPVEIPLQEGNAIEFGSDGSATRRSLTDEEQAYESDIYPVFALRGGPPEEHANGFQVMATPLQGLGNETPMDAARRYDLEAKRLRSPKGTEGRQLEIDLTRDLSEVNLVLFWSRDTQGEPVAVEFRIRASGMKQIKTRTSSYEGPGVAHRLESDSIYFDASSGEWISVLLPVPSGAESYVSSTRILFDESYRIPEAEEAVLDLIITNIYSQP